MCVYCSIMTVYSADIFFLAHPDDDLLFQSPSLLYSIRETRNATSDAQHCLSTIYFTAGDAGLTWESGYPGQRQSGVRAAYRVMSDGQTRNQRQIWYTLPDGNADGAGYPAHNNTSLRKLYEGSISDIGSIVTGSQRRWTLASFKEAMLGHLRTYPTAGLTVHLQDWQTTNELIGPNGDHSDHVVGAKIVRDVLVENENEFKDVTVVRYVTVTSA